MHTARNKYSANGYDIVVINHSDNEEDIENFKNNIFSDMSMYIPNSYHEKGALVSLYRSYTNDHEVHYTVDFSPFKIRLASLYYMIDMIDAAFNRKAEVIMSLYCNGVFVKKFIPTRLLNK